MSHFLRKDEMYPRRRVFVRACVAGEVHQYQDGTCEIVTDGKVRFTKGTEFAPVPDRAHVVGPGHEPIEPTWGFWVSLETFDPFHLITDWDGR